jgi:hypothetical protein
VQIRRLHRTPAAGDRAHAPARKYRAQRDFDYQAVDGLSHEVRQKLQLPFVRQTLAQAARIPGVTPAAISLLLIHLKQAQLPLPGERQTRMSQRSVAATEQKLTEGLQALGLRSPRRRSSRGSSNSSRCSRNGTAPITSPRSTIRWRWCRDTCSTA